MKYKERIADKTLERKLLGKGAVLIEGPKWCGKTTTAEQHAKSVLYMSETGKVQQNLKMASMNPKALLRGGKPRLIDEWQIAPTLWDGIRFEVDHAGAMGQYILTGSSVPADRSAIFHTGTGRFAWLKMRTMSLWESGDSTGEVSLRQLFDSPEQIEGISHHSLEDIAYLTCRGGWPGTLPLPKNVALDQALDYVDAVAEQDLSNADGVRRSPATVRRLLRSYARHQGAQATFATLRQDMLVNEGEEMTEVTIAAYVNALKRIFVVEDVEAWNPNLRSKTAIRTSDTRYFADPSIATAALGLGPTDLMNDLETFGLIFETLCLRDLRVFAEAMDGRVYHYRDKQKLECDAVVHLRNGSYGLVEIKLGGDAAVEEGAKSLQALAKKIDTTKMRHPSLMMVLTAVGPYAYRRPDGVLVVPIGCLKD